MARPRVLIAPDKFKGSLDARQVAGIIADTLTEQLPDLVVETCPVSDGGDGLLIAALAAGYRRIPVTAAGPTNMAVSTAYARNGVVGVVELADISGLGRLPGDPDPLGATTRGTGEVIAAALRDGCREVVLGIGGSASTDGGAGMVSALGARILNHDGAAVGDGGAALAEAARLQLSELAPELAAARILVASDVDNPLLGARGAAAIYGPQKGADPDQVAVLDAALGTWADVVAAATGRDLRELPGAGAAGGTGFGAVAVLGAELRPGIELVLELVGFEQALERADLVITGEGSLDEQTLHGKAPAGIAAAARARGVEVIAICGRNQLSAGQLRAAGFARAYALTDLEPDPERSMAVAPELLAATARSLAAELAGR